MKSFYRSFTLMTLFLSSLLVSAQDSTFTFTGYIDLYYAFDYSQPANPVDPNNLSTRNQRLYVTQYDQHNAFTLNHAFIQGKYNKNKISAEIALQVGSFPVNNYAHEPSPLYRMIHRANVGYQLTEKSRFDVGVLGGHFGYESALAIERELLSPALATEYTPYYQTGIQYSAELSETTSIRAVVLNGWQTMAETDQFKSVGMAIDQQIGESLTVSYGNYFGRQSDESPTSPRIQRFHHNVVVNFTKEKFGLVGIWDYTNQKWYFDISDPVQKGRALFLTGIAYYHFNEKFRIAGRFEYVEDSDRVLIGSLNEPMELTVTSLALDYRPEENISFKFEPKLYAGQNDNFFGVYGFKSGMVVLCAGVSLWLN